MLERASTTRRRRRERRVLATTHRRERWRRARTPSWMAVRSVSAEGTKVRHLLRGDVMGRVPDEARDVCSARGLLLIHDADGLVVLVGDDYLTNVHASLEFAFEALGERDIDFPGDGSGDADEGDVFGLF